MARVVAYLYQGELHPRLPVRPFVSNRLAQFGIARPGTLFNGRVRAYYRPAD